MNKMAAAFRKRSEKKKEQSQRDAQEEVLQELFEDMYKNRKRIYRVNFVRGIFFGLGSAVGGTLVVALIIWLLSLVINFPLIGDYFRDIQQAIERSSPVN